MTTKPLHIRLVEARVKAGFANPNQAAEATGISVKTIYRAESGKFKTGVTTLTTLALGYRLPPDFFLKDETDTQSIQEYSFELELPDSWPVAKKLRAIKMIREFAQNIIKLIEGEEE